MKRTAWPVLVLAVAACDPGSGVPGPTSEGTPEAPVVSSVEPGRNVECVGTEAHVLTTTAPGGDDLVVGAISWPGLRSWATADPRDYGDPATGDYKIGAVVQAGAQVTVAIPAGHADSAGLAYGRRWAYSPAPMVTFHACDNGDTAFIGGFHLVRAACVPLVITEPGRPPAEVTVSFFAGACPS